MDDIRRQDLRIFLKECISPNRIVITILAVFFSARALFSAMEDDGVLYAFLIGFTIVGISATEAWFRSEKNRWQNPRMRALWEGCEDRLVRFEETTRKLRKEQIADLHELPKTIRGVYRSLYAALRRADMIAEEVQRSERDLYTQPPVWSYGAHDPQSQELYRLADKNIAEYRANFAGLMSGVQRTEAQSAVFMTTLDTLRMKTLSYRLAGKSPELNSRDMLEVLAEARAQLQSIDTALEELDLGHYPTMIAVVPPPPPEDSIRQHLNP